MKNKSMLIAVAFGLAQSINAHATTYALPELDGPTLEMARELIEKGAKKYAEDHPRVFSSGTLLETSPLTIASYALRSVAINGNGAQIECVFKGLDVDREISAEAGESHPARMLEVSAWACNSAAVAKLIELGADINPPAASAQASDGRFMALVPAINRARYWADSSATKLFEFEKATQDRIEVRRVPGPYSYWVAEPHAQSPHVGTGSTPTEALRSLVAQQEQLAKQANACKATVDVLVRATEGVVGATPTP